MENILMDIYGGIKKLTEDYLQVCLQPSKYSEFNAELCF